MIQRSELSKKGQNSQNKSQVFWLKGQVASRACPAARGVEQIDARPWYNAYFHEGVPLRRTVILNVKTTSALRDQVTVLAKIRVLSNPRQWKLLARGL